MFYLFAKSVTTPVIAGVLLASFVAGWAAEFIMGRAGFGIFGNAFLVMIGIFLGFLGLSYFGYGVDDNVMLTLGAGAGAAVIALLLPALMRKL